ncbi:MAG: hypothetical protein IJM82_07155 [Synergistaceae bacterium]|nr:hypothetical protein [Synergistaceae bacterium]MBQ7068927.1 hypothetical protein [Synergistaceae bacterium]
MRITKTDINNISEKIENVMLSENSYYDNDTDYILSNPATVREILEGLSTSWEDCVPEDEVFA